VTGAENFERALRIHEAREHHAEHFQLQLKKEWHEFEAHKQHANLLDKVPDSRGEDCDASERGDRESRETWWKVVAEHWWGGQQLCY